MRSFNLHNNFQLDNLKVWMSYMSENMGDSLLANNPFNSASYFFSMPMVFDISGQDGKLTLNLLYLQDWITANTLDFTLNVNTIAKNSNLVNNTFLSEVFTDELAETLNFFGLTPLNDITLSLMKDMKNITELKNDVEGMRDVLPNFCHHVEDITVQCEEGSPIIDSLATPDVKLYYPEPFIASPSFVHEDLWFIHILHYQH